MLTHGELFAGISGFGFGFAMSGIETLWHVEIDPNCRKVLAHWFPGTAIREDVREAGADNLGYVDIISFGSPCQDLSVAGKRKGLQNGTRSSLFFEAARIIREINPRYAIWENVPGAFSSNRGRDFQAVLAELLQRDVPMPGSGRWATAGMARSRSGTLAWRVMDAQFFGVPQRRRRLFLVFCPRGDDPAEILFEREGLQGDPPAREKAGKGITRPTAGRTAAGHRVGRAQEVQHLEGGPAGALSGLGDLAQEGCLTYSLAFGGNNTSGPIDVSAALNAHGGTGRIDFESETFIANLAPDVSGTLDSKCTSANRGSQANETEFLIPVAFDARNMTGTGDVSMTLQAGSKGTSVNNAPIIACAHETGQGFWSEGLPGLRSQPGGMPENIVAFKWGNGKDSRSLGEGPQSPTLAAGGGGNSVPAIAWEMSSADLAPTLSSSGAGLSRVGGQGAEPDFYVSLTAPTVNQVPMVGVRRLTPTECARLQGFPDNWNDWLSDSVRYKQYGNAVCAAVTEWLGRRIQAAEVA